ncbi:MAG: type II toxin-antitoxin system RelE/ParE family toxin [Thiocapsa sp.]|uniref:type II toxin-antitoxin system RelE family toxin n=1 Tax=Thiocapsa sp. TaxID=2024551 RepID=UPI001BCDB53F|nr:type II toxin-antitoxin system RelE/ParE family toxin [Thiocapsa sp.]QVL50850.1 MAG: type II toxin-antitoxin system RelE/ParE family toxin [Thiocapsa sp.]
MRIEWRNKARKQLKKLRNPQAVERILSAVEDFADGRPCDVKALINHAYSHRLRVGEFRVLMTVQSVVEICWVEEVKKRDERTY